MPKVLRVQLDIAKERVKEIDAMQAKCGLATRKDVFESAMTLFEWCVEQVSTGKRIVSMDATERYFELEMPALEKAKSKRAVATLSALNEDEKKLLRAALSALKRQRFANQPSLNASGNKYADIERLESLIVK